MWSSWAHSILKNRIAYIVVIAVITCFMLWHTLRVQLSYTFARPLPSSDSTLINYDNFKKLFGEDGNVMVIGFSDSNFFELAKFNDWYQLGEEIKKIDGIRDVISLANLYNLQRDDSLMKFDFVPIIKSKPKSQAELDSLKEIILSLPFYEGLAYSTSRDATLMTVTFDNDKLNTRGRIAIVDEIKEKAVQFGKKHNLSMHYSGMPYIRTEYSRKVGYETKLFLWLAVLVTAIILVVFFRSFRVVLFSMIVVGIGIIWSMGSIHLFGYEITMLTGLIAPLITIIALPNCIFVINKFHSEVAIHGNKMKALKRTIIKVGLSNFLANITTAIGFFVFYFTNSKLLVEFGIIAAINVMATYAVAMIIIPILLSYSKLPKTRHTKHLSGKRINKIINVIDHLVHFRRKMVYLVVVIITGIAIIGMYRIQLIGFVVDDLPKNDPITTDLKFFEKHFNGVLPFEISIDTRKANGVFGSDASTLYKMKAVQKMMAGYNEFSRPLSVVEALKFAYQSYRGGNRKYYILPNILELKKLSDYTQTVTGKENKFSSFIDTNKRYTRISYQMADVGSIRMKELVKEIKPRIDSLMDPSEYTVNLTGHSLVFLKGNDYLYYHLFISLIIAIIAILLIGIILFRSISIIVLSKIPCLIPLVITAGIMGFFGIPFKPSTILIFSIAFGIASDGTIYILTEYRNQLRKLVGQNSHAVSNTIREVGVSMVYTAMILFCGFAIFSASSFGGTAALGVLISLTLLVSMVSNLVLLPAILLSLENRLNKRVFMKDPMVSIFNEEEDIELDQIEIEKNEPESALLEEDNKEL